MDRLKASYPDVSPDEVTMVVQDDHARIEGSPVQDFIPLLTERRASPELATARD